MHLYMCVSVASLHAGYLVSIIIRLKPYVCKVLTGISLSGIVTVINRCKISFPN